MTFSTNCDNIIGVMKMFFKSKETIPEGENLVSFNSGLTGENIAVYVWDGVTPIPMK